MPVNEALDKKVSTQRQEAEKKITNNHSPRIVGLEIAQAQQKNQRDVQTEERTSEPRKIIKITKPAKQKQKNISVRQTPQETETISEDVINALKSRHEEQSLGQGVPIPHKVETSRFAAEDIEETEVLKNEAAQKSIEHTTAVPEQMAPFEIDEPMQIVYGETKPEVFVATNRETLQESVYREKVHEYIALTELAEEYKEIEPLEIGELVVTYETSETYENAEEQPIFIEQVADYIARNEVIDEEQKTKAGLLIKEIVAISHEIIELKLAETSENAVCVEQIEERLEEVCVELLEIMGVEYDEEIVKRFVQTIVKQEIAKKMKSLEQEEILDEGTHERKHFTVRNVISELRDDMQTLYSLGKYAVATTM